jgi:hypothetical protein
MATPITRNPPQPTGRITSTNPAGGKVPTSAYEGKTPVAPQVPSEARNK